MLKSGPTTQLPAFSHLGTFSDRTSCEFVFHARQLAGDMGDADMAVATAVSGRQPTLELRVALSKTSRSPLNVVLLIAHGSSAAAVPLITFGVLAKAVQLDTTGLPASVGILDAPGPPGFLLHGPNHPQQLLDPADCSFFK